MSPYGLQIYTPYVPMRVKNEVYFERITHNLGTEVVPVFDPFVSIRVLGHLDIQLAVASSVTVCDSTVLHVATNLLAVRVLYSQVLNHAVNSLYIFKCNLPAALRMTTVGYFSPCFIIC